MKTSWMDWICALLIATGFTGMAHQAYIDADGHTLIPYAVMAIVGMIPALPRGISYAVTGVASLIVSAVWLILILTNLYPYLVLTSRL